MKGKKKMGIIIICAVLAIAAVVFVVKMFVGAQEEVVIETEFGDHDIFEEGYAISVGAAEGEELEPEYIEIDESTYYGEIVAGLRKMKAGSNYIEGEVIGEAASMKEAKKVAEALNAEVSSCSDGIAVYQIKMPVLDFMTMLAQANEEAIKVSPNYIYTTN